MVIEGLFPTPIGKTTLSKALTKEQFQFIRNQPMRLNMSNRSSMNNYLLETKELADVKEELTQVVRNYFKEVYAPRDGIDVYITQSWSNVTKSGEYHHAHTHPNSFLSGVLYVRTEDTDNILFVRPIVNGVDINLNPANWNVFNSITWQYPVKTGDIVIFPSALGHEVPNTTSNNDRISLAFNVFLKGRLGNPTDLTELYLP